MLISNNPDIKFLKLQQRGNVFWSLTEFECLPQVYNVKSSLSRLYTLLLKNNVAIDNAKLRWEKELSSSLSTDK